MKDLEHSLKYMPYTLYYCHDIYYKEWTKKGWTKKGINNKSFLKLAWLKKVYIPKTLYLCLEILLDEDKYYPERIRKMLTLTYYLPNKDVAGIAKLRINFQG